jgi:MoaA/NifB/PqqE/SkfB family radical SAM enzyme
MEGSGLARGSRAVKRRALERAQPLSAYLEITYACNWRCAFCYNPRHHDLRRLSLDEWAEVLDDLRSLGTLNVTLTGGEPLTHPDWLEIARAVKQRAFTLRLFTNGTLVSERVADAIAALRPLAVEMSLHGATAETHDRATATPGSHAALFAAIGRLRSRAVPCVLKTVLTRLNETELDLMIARVAEIGVPYRLDATLSPRDDGDLGPLGYAASRGAIARLYERVAAQGELPGAQRRTGGSNCGVGRITLAVDPDGNVYPCMQWRHAALGNVRATRLRDLWAGSGARQEAAAAAREANDALVEEGGAVARFPFCPALAHQHTGSVTTVDPAHRLRAEIADQVRGGLQVRGVS